MFANCFFSDFLVVYRLFIVCLLFVFFAHFLGCFLIFLDGFCLLHWEITATEVVATLKVDDTWHLLCTRDDDNDDMGKIYRCCQRLSPWSRWYQWCFLLLKLGGLRDGFQNLSFVKIESEPPYWQRGVDDNNAMTILKMTYHQEFFLAEPGTEHVLLLPYDLLRSPG